MNTVRTPLEVTFSVWKALFLREAVQRLFSARASWAWLLLEPLAHIVFLIFLFSTIRMRVIGGIDTPVWVMVGLLAFFMFKRVGTQAMNAIAANQALFAYRQVKPIDAVLTRAGLEGFLMILVAVILFTGVALFGLSILPGDLLAVLEAFLGLWLVGLGFGLMVSVASVLVPEIASIIGLLMTPLYFLSGVIFPLAVVPLPYREWIMYNPVAHGIEAARHGFASYYQVVPETSIAYLYGFAMVTIFLGLALHTRFAIRLVTK